MTPKKPTYEELEARLAEAEAIIATLQAGQVDAVLSQENILMVRLKEAEAALRQKQAQLETVLQQLPVGVIIAEAPSGKLIIGNEQVRRIWRQEFLPSESIDQYDRYRGFHADGQPYLPHEWPLARSITTGEQVVDEEIKFQRGDGSFGWMSTNSGPICDAGGNTIAAVVIFQDIAGRKKTEEALRQLTESLEQRVTDRTAQVRQQADQLRALTLQLSQTEQRERRRMAQTLHDYVQQFIVAAKLRVEWIVKQTAGSDQLHGPARQTDEILDKALEASRALTLDLYPPALETDGLTGGLNWLADSMRQKYELRVDLRLDNGAEPAGEEMRYFLFDSARELLFNTVKHAGVKEAALTLTRTADGRIELAVADQGRGFEPDRLRNRNSQELTYGLFSLQQRLAHLGGRLEIESASGEGTTVTLTAPVEGGELPGETEAE